MHTLQAELQPVRLPRCASDELEGASVYTALELLGNGTPDDDDEADSDVNSSDGDEDENSTCRTPEWPHRRRRSPHGRHLWRAIW